MTEPSAFKFRRRTGQIDWSLVSRLDVQSISRDSDVSSLQSLIDMVTFADLESELGWRGGSAGRGVSVDPGFLKVAQLAQLMIEYLHATQHRTAIRAKMVQDRAVTLSHELDSCRSELKEREAQLGSLKRETKQLRKTVETLETALRVSSTSSTGNGTVCLGPAATVATCPICKKQFRGAEYLRSHVERRHPESVESQEVFEALERSRGVFGIPQVFSTVQQPQQIVLPMQQGQAVHFVPAPVTAAAVAPPAAQNDATLEELRGLRSELSRLSLMKQEVSEQVDVMLSKEREMFMREKEELERAHAESLTRVQDDLQKARQVMRKEISELRTKQQQQQQQQRKQAPATAASKRATAPIPKQQNRPRASSIPLEKSPTELVRSGLGDKLETDSESDTGAPATTFPLSRSKAPTLKRGQIAAAGAPEKSKRRRVASGSRAPLPNRPYLQSEVPHTAEEVAATKESLERLLEKSLQQLDVQGTSIQAARYDRLMAFIEQKRTPVLEAARRRTEQEVEEIVQRQYIDLLPLPASADPVIPPLTSTNPSPAALMRSRASSLSLRSSLRRSVASGDEGEGPARPMLPSQPTHRVAPDSLRSALSSSVSALMSSLRSSQDHSQELTSSLPLVRGGSPTPLLRAALTRGAGPKDQLGSSMRRSYGPAKPQRPLGASMSAPGSPTARRGGMSPQDGSPAESDEDEDVVIPENEDSETNNDQEDEDDEDDERYENESGNLQASASMPSRDQKGQKSGGIKGLFGKLASSLKSSPRNSKEPAPAPARPPPAQPTTVYPKQLPAPPSKPIRAQVNQQPAAAAPHQPPPPPVAKVIVPTQVQPRVTNPLAQQSTPVETDEEESAADMVVEEQEEEEDDDDDHDETADLADKILQESDLSSDGSPGGHAPLRMEELEDDV